MSIRTTRQLILSIRGNFCEYCGKGIDIDTSTLDHIIPISKGGNNELENFRVCCKSCNSAKHNRSIEEFRYTMRIKSSKYYKVISATTAKRLIEEFGLPIELPDYKFRFEMEVQNGSN